jgi:hypothetical protein
MLTIAAGSKAEFIFTGKATSLLFARWQVSVLPSALAGGAKSFFKALPTTQQFTSSAYTVLASIAVPITPGFTILELLATFSFVNNNADSDVDTRFIIRDSVSGATVPPNGGILNGSNTSAPNAEGAAGAVVFRGDFAPGLHIFTLEVAVFGGPISIGGVGEMGNASLYIQQASA